MPTMFSKYRKYLNHADLMPSYGLCEGLTPLVRSKHIGMALGENINLFFKAESFNPSYSYKDRGVSNAVSFAVRAGKVGIACCSSGNLGISCAMYAARAALKAVVLIPKLYVNEEKIRRMQMYDATVIIVDGGISAGTEMAYQLAEKYNFEVISHKNVNYCTGLKTVAFETCDQLGRAPDIFCCGIGYGATMGYIWRGFKEYYSCGNISRLPVMIGIEAAADSNARYLSGHFYQHSTVLNEIGISAAGRDVLEDALIARDESSGYITSVNDEQTIAAYQLISKKEGILSDISSSVCVSGLYKLKSDGVDFDNMLIVSLLSGISDASEVMYSETHAISKIKVIKPNLEDLESELVI